MDETKVHEMTSSASSSSSHPDQTPHSNSLYSSNTCITPTDLTASSNDELQSIQSSIPPSKTSAPNDLVNYLRSTSSFALSNLKSQTRHILSRQRRSFITDTTTSSKKKAIISIALRKGLLVFFSVHTVISASMIALALVRQKGAKISKIRTGSVSPTPWHSSGKRLIQIFIESFRSPSTARLASWLGLYSTLWTLTYSFLRKCENSFSHWNAFIAGSLCGVSFFAQSKGDRKELAPNVICRALYSVFMCYPLCHLKHGDMLLFALSNAQIAIGYLLYPSTLPSWYVHWISRVGGLNPRYVELNRQMSRSLVSSKANIIKDHHQLLFQDTLPRSWKNESRIQNWLNSSNFALRKNAPCALNHYRYESCLASNFYLFLRTMVKMCPTYAILHLVPALIFRSKILIKSPIQFISSIIKKTISSGLFLGTFCSVVQNCFCIPSKLYENCRISLPATPFYGLLGFSTGVSLLWEEPKRRGELALYCAPKALYSLWAVLKSKKIIPKIIFGDVLVCSIGSGILMHCFVHKKDKMPALARGIIDQLVDPHIPDLGKSNRGSLCIDKSHDVDNHIDNNVKISNLPR